MLANMACSLIEHKRINTTHAKAKALRQFIEPLITKSKADNNVSAERGTHNRRIVFKNLRDKYAVTELFSVVAEKVADRPGGYTRIIKLGNRLGDNADMAMIELVDFNELYNAGKAKKKSTRRSRRSGSKKDDATATESTEVATSEVDSSDKATVEKSQESLKDIVEPINEPTEPKDKNDAQSKSAGSDQPEPKVDIKSDGSTKAEEKGAKPSTSEKTSKDSNAADKAKENPDDAKK